MNIQEVSLSVLSFVLKWSLKGIFLATSLTILYWAAMAFITAEDYISKRWNEGNGIIAVWLSWCVLVSVIAFFYGATKLYD